MSRLTPLPRSFYARDAETVAQELLGALLVCRADGKERVGRIVETEAYLGPHDLACHTAHGKTKRNATMFGEAGHAYVYLVYGMYHCVNVVTGHGEGQAVLIRALEPVVACAGKTSGPGLLCRAFGISRTHDGADLCGNTLFIAAPDATHRVPMARRPRVGVDYAGAWAKRLLRFYVKNNPFVSKP